MNKLEMINENTFPSGLIKFFMPRFSRGRVLVLLLGVFIFGQSARTQAQEVREFFNGSRMLGMGGASIAVVNDETALLSNPAGLGKLRDFYGTIIDPEVDTSSNISTIYNQRPFSDIFDLDQVKNTLDKTRDSDYHARAQVFPSFVAKNFGIGIFGKYSLDAKMNADGTQMDTSYYDDLAILLGFNFRLFDGRLKLGVVGKAINRIEIVRVLDTSTSLDKKSLASEGVGIGGDAGIILSGPWTWIPTLSAVVRDVGGTKFESGSGLRMTTNERPVQVKQDIDVAVAVFPIHGNRTRSSMTFEYQKINEASLAADKSRYYHLGYELNLSDLLFLRAGMNQRYWTAGLELSSENMQIQLASYGEDVGVDGSPVESRRFVLKVALRF